MGTFVVAAFLVLFSWVAEASAPNLPIDIASSPCAREFTDRVTAYGSKMKDFRRFIDTFDGNRVYRAPSTKIGYWFELQIAEDHSIKGYEVTPNAVVAISANKEDCRLSAKIKPRKLDKLRMERSFTDQDLENLANDYPKGALIVAWSPGMPLSLQMIANARKVSKHLDIPVKIVLDPHVNRRMAEQVATENDLGDVLTPMESVELMFQGLSTHYPALILLQDKKIASPVFPGLSGVQQMINFVEDNARAKSELKAIAQSAKYDSSTDLITGGIHVEGLVSPKGSKEGNDYLLFAIIALLSIGIITIYFKVKK